MGQRNLIFVDSLSQVSEKGFPFPWLVIFSIVEVYKMAIGMNINRAWLGSPYSGPAVPGLSQQPNTMGQWMNQVYNPYIGGQGGFMPPGDQGLSLDYFGRLYGLNKPGGGLSPAFGGNYNQLGAGIGNLLGGR